MMERSPFVTLEAMTYEMARITCLTVDYAYIKCLVGKALVSHVA